MAGAHRRPQRRSVPSGFRTRRDRLSYVLGALILVHQVLIAKEISWELMLVAMTLLGTPLALGSGDRDVSPPPKQPSKDERTSV